MAYREILDNGEIMKNIAAIDIPVVELTVLKTKEQYKAFLEIESARFLQKEAARLAPAVAEEIDFDRNDIEDLDEAFDSGVMDAIGQAINYGKPLSKVVCWNDMDEGMREYFRQHRDELATDENVDLLTASTLLKLVEYQEDDKGLWEGQTPLQQIASMTYFSIRNELWWKLEEDYKEVAARYIEKLDGKTTYADRLAVATEVLEHQIQCLLQGVESVKFGQPDYAELAALREEVGGLKLAIERYGHSLDSMAREIEVGLVDAETRDDVVAKRAILDLVQRAKGELDVNLSGPGVAP